MPTITIFPTQFAYAENRIIVRIFDDSPNFKYFTYTVGGEVFEAMRDANNEAYIDIAPLLRASFDLDSYPMPTLPPTIQPNNNQQQIIRNYTLLIESVMDTIPNETTSFQGWAVMGGLPDLEIASDASLVYFLPALQPFVTKIVTPNSLEFITFSNTALPSTPAPNLVALDYWLYDEVGAEILAGSIDVDFVEKGKTTLIDVSYSRLAADATMPVFSYKVRLHVLQTIDYYSQFYYYKVDNAYYPETTEILYINPRGGLSSIVLTGNRVDGLEVNRIIVDKKAPLYASPIAPRRQSIIANQTASFTVGTGFFEAWTGEFERVKDLFGAKMLWERRGDNLVPIVATGKKMDTHKTPDAQLVSEEIEFTYAIKM